MKREYIVRNLLSWFARHARDLPWRRARAPYAIWVSEIMLQQTQVKTVLPYWERWMRALPTLSALAKAKPERIHKLWEGLGYYSRVRNLQAAARLMLKRHDGRFPENFTDLLALPGIGRYTAGAICSIAFNQPAPILDGNVIRVLTRLFGVRGDPRKKRVNTTLWNLAEALVQQAAKSSATRACSHLNQSLMELGALVCTPKQPQCGICPVADCCVACLQGRVEQLPALQPRARSTERRFVAFIVRKRGRLMARQRPAGVVNAHFWEFPNTEVGFRETDLNKVARQTLGVKPVRLEPLCTIKHTITRYRITLEVVRATVNHGAYLSSAAGRWLNSHDLLRKPFTAAHRKILRHLQIILP
ncbi:MAG TPA: A/G-specific adenine glycosylase [Candidatus Binatia bacterium]|nr:A/G-specific adenine glycosylase [Candidatus Binatia bacterium]